LHEPSGFGDTFATRVLFYGVTSHLFQPRGAARKKFKRTAAHGQTARHRGNPNGEAIADVSDLKSPTRDDGGGELRGDQAGERNVTQKRLDEFRHGGPPRSSFGRKLIESAEK
jgi:hypothetical protein